MQTLPSPRFARPSQREGDVTLPLGESALKAGEGGDLTECVGPIELRKNGRDLRLLALGTPSTKTPLPCKMRRRWTC